jgi:hypothetical protein
MSEFVCYLPSYNDSELLRESLASCGEWNVVISDNASSEPHRSALAALASDRVRVIRHETSLGRVGNWKFCVRHFIESGALWMKFLLSGDRHKPDALGIFRRALACYPQARFIVPRIENVLPQGRETWGPTDVPGFVLPADAMAAVATSGNPFHGLLAPLIHVEMVRDGFDFGEGVLSFCADLRFLMEIARKTRPLFLVDVIGEFVAANRRHFRVGYGGLEHILEEGLMRLRAADAFLALSGDQQRRDELVRQVRTWLLESLPPRSEPPG